MSMLAAPPPTSPPGAWRWPVFRAVLLVLGPTFLLHQARHNTRWARGPVTTPTCIPQPGTRARDYQPQEMGFPGLYRSRPANILSTFPGIDVYKYGTFTLKTVHFIEINLRGQNWPMNKWKVIIENWQMHLLLWKMYGYEFGVGADNLRKKRSNWCNFLTLNLIA